METAKSDLFSYDRKASSHWDKAALNISEDKVYFYTDSSILWWGGGGRKAFQIQTQELSGRWGGAGPRTSLPTLDAGPVQHRTPLLGSHYRACKHCIVSNHMVRERVRVKREALLGYWTHRKGLKLRAEQGHWKKPFIKSQHSLRTRSRIKNQWCSEVTRQNTNPAQFLTSTNDVPH